VDDTDAPKIVFPCDYPIKVVGTASAELHTIVREVMIRHAPGFDEAMISIRDSAQGNYQAITITIIATGEAQLRAIHSDLKQNPQVKLVL